MSRRKKVVSLAARRVEPVPEVIAGLEDLLARAKRGEIRGFVFAASADMNCDATAFVLGDGSIASLYLGIERAKVRLLEYRGEES